jgi:hypothetical protein
MKKSIFFLIAVLFSVAASAQQITKSFVADDFTGITAASVFDIELIKSPVESVVVTADREVMNYVNIKVVMGQLNLKIDTDKMPRILKKNLKSVKVKINMKNELSWLSLSGACKLTSSSNFTPQNFKGQISGASSICGLEITSESARISISGASSVSMRGKINIADYELSGASNAVINQEISTLSVKCSGASKIDFKGSIASLDLKLSGSSEAKLKGSGEEIRTQISGASKLIAVEFAANEAYITISGVSKAVVNVSKTLEAEISGSSHLEYKGSPVINNVSVNSISNFKKIY